MLRPQSLDVQQLYQYLRASLRRGARACDLLRHVPAMIELLYPAVEHPHLSEHDRALWVEADIRTVIDTDIGGASGEAVAAVLALRPGTLGRTLGDRRGIAARHLNIEPETFRRPRYEKALLFHVSFELYRHYQARQDQPLVH